MPMKLKIEINTTEHFNALDLHYKKFSIDSSWFSGSCVITTYQLEELMATKLRALFQRRKGRDLFDIFHIFANNLANTEDVIEIFKLYCERGGTPITQKRFLDNMKQKRINSDFQSDMILLLPEGINWDFAQAFEFVQNTIITKIS